MSMPHRPATPTGRPPGRTAVLLVLAALVLAAAVAAWGWLVTHPLAHPLREENDVNRWLAGRRTGRLTDVADGGTLLGQTVTGAVVLAVSAAVFALWRRTWWPIVFVAALDAGLGLFYLVGTTLDPRQRPPVHILQSGLVQDASFPSGHTGTATGIAACLAALLWAYTRVAAAWLAVLVVVPAYTLLSRLYVGAHHVSDVLTASVYAAVWGLVCARLLLPERTVTRDRAARAREPAAG
jgi:membrane-associated phospholipid phosphatase